MVVTLSHLGYIKRNPITQYRAQRRGGKGAKGMATREEDFVESLFVASTHAYILFFTNRGRALAEGPRAAAARPRREGQGDRERAAAPAGRAGPGDAPGAQLRGGGRRVRPALTRKGVIKKTSLSTFSNPRRGGHHRDQPLRRRRADLRGPHRRRRRGAARHAQGQVDPLPEERGARHGPHGGGVRGIALASDDEVVGMEILSPGATVLTVTERGYGKRTPSTTTGSRSAAVRASSRSVRTTRNGAVIGVAQVVDDDEVMLITDGGKVLRCPVGGISSMGRATQGVRVMRPR